MILGLDIAAHDTAAVLAEPGGAMRLALRSPLPREGGSPATWQAAVDNARATMVQAGVEPLDIKRAVIAFPGPVDASNRVTRGLQTDGWEGFDLGDALCKHLGIVSAAAETRVVCEALGELHYGSLRAADGPSRDWLYVHLGSTIGAAAMSGGVLMRGAGRTAVDLGAICLDRDGPLATGGKRGSLDAYCGGDSFVARARSYGITMQKAHEVWELAAGNFAASSLCDEYATRLAQGLSIALALYNPSLLALSGPIMAQVGDRLLGPLRLSIKDYALPAHLNGLEIRSGSLGADAAVLGAVALANQE